MTQAEIANRVRATVDQFYHFPNRVYIAENQLQFIGGVLQTALHLVDFGTYNDIKQYIYKTYGYDPGGCTDGQISLDDMQEVNE